MLLNVIPLLFAIAPPSVAVSDQTGVYAVLDYVELHPNAEAPTKIVMRGAFAVAGGRAGSYYRAPQYGRMVFTLPEKGADQSAAQWRELSDAVGSKQVVGFGFRYHLGEAAVVPPTGPLPAGTPFHPGMGMNRIRHANYGPIASLRHFPTPVSPVLKGDETVTAGNPQRPQIQVDFVAKPGIQPADGTRYLIEVERADGEVFGSELLDVENGEIRWSCSLAPAAGEAVTWRVRPVHEQLSRAPVAVARFVVGERER